MTKRERALFKSLKRLRDALWDSGASAAFESSLNKAYISADSLIATIEREQATRRGSARPKDGGGAHG